MLSIIVFYTFSLRHAIDDTLQMITLSSSPFRYALLSPLLRCRDAAGAADAY